jgi:hypothetical protein
LIGFAGQVEGRGGLVQERFAALDDAGGLHPVAAGAQARGSVLAERKRTLSLFPQVAASDDPLEDVR